MTFPIIVVSVIFQKTKSSVHVSPDGSNSFSVVVREMIEASKKQTQKIDLVRAVAVNLTLETIEVSSILVDVGLRYFVVSSQLNIH